MTVAQWRARAEVRLAAAKNPDAKVDSRIFLEEILGLESLRLRADRLLSREELARLEEALSRRLAGEPLQYILEKAWFMGLTLRVDPGVLIPRQDTETLVEWALECLKSLRAPRVLDLCAGSGAIGLAVAKYRPDAFVTLTDLSPEALKVARQNAEAMGVSAEILRGDLFQAVAGRTFDLIACNPPYIPSGDLEGLQAEVQREPRLALDGGADGLDFYRRIAREAPRYLKSGGDLLLEVGIGQAQEVASLVGGETRRDLNGVERVVRARRAASQGRSQ